LAAIKVKQTGITDYAAITRKFLAQFEKNGGEILFGHKVTELNESNDSVKVKTHQKTIESDCLVNCAGLYSDVLSGFLTDHAVSSDIQIIPFRGDYYRLPASLNQLINHLIYPVPDPELPFLGVHLTRMIDGSITVGPNAALAFARESYGNTSFNLKELGQSARFPGLWKLLARYPRAALNELRYSWSKTAYLSAVNKYCPQVRKEHLLPYRSGVRAQAVNKNGEMLHDFAFSNTQRTLHLANAPSPAATSSLPIADEVVNRLEHLM
jgi:L-2-hydroxyglutarate oxidase